MATEILEITDSNQPGIHSQLEHIVTDLHDALKMLRDQGIIQARHDAMLAEFSPLLAQLRSPLAAAATRRTRARRQT